MSFCPRFGGAFLCTLSLLILVLSSTSHAPAASVGGTLDDDTIWSGDVIVYANVIVPANIKLTVGPGTVLHLTNGASITAQAGGIIEIAGTAGNPVSLSPINATANWGSISASGANSFVTIRHAELARGAVNLGSQATALIEDTYVHDIGSAIVANSARIVTMRRVHVKNYSETIFNSGTIILAEDSLFENLTAGSSDALEIQGGPPGSIIRRCTFRHASGNNSDLVDFNGTSGVLVQDCLIYDTTDKGISLGASGAGGSPDHGIIVRNCLIYNTRGPGIAIKDGTTCGLYNLTIHGCPSGFQLYQKFNTPVDGGHITNSYNNILWGNGTSIYLTNDSSVVASYCNFEGTNWPGTGNVDVDPLFQNVSENDFRLATNSPLRGAGLGGSDMGAQFPVGAPMALSHPRIESLTSAGTEIHMSFWVDPEKSYSLVASDTPNGEWGTIADIFPTPLPRLATVTNSIDSTARFYRLVTPALP
jgi:hypothetical protein